MDKRTAYNANAIVKIVLIPEEKSRRWIWTRDRQKWGGFLGCSIKHFKVEEFAWCEVGHLLGEPIISHEEFLKEYPHYKIINIEEGFPEAFYKAHVNVEFTNGEIHTEYFHSNEKAEQYFNRLTDMKGQVPFEFDAFL